MTNFNRSNNPHLITSTQAVAEAGYPSVEEYLAKQGLDSVIIACCDEGCEVEPDGYCEHGCPSVIVAKGLI
jgi:hypothetical protein